MVRFPLQLGVVLVFWCIAHETPSINMESGRNSVAFSGFVKTHPSACFSSKRSQMWMFGWYGWKLLILLKIKSVTWSEGRAAEVGFFGVSDTGHHQMRRTKKKKKKKEKKERKRGGRKPPNQINSLPLMPPPQPPLTTHQPSHLLLYPIFCLHLCLIFYLLFCLFCLLLCLLSRYLSNPLPIMPPPLLATTHQPPLLLLL